MKCNHAKLRNPSEQVEVEVVGKKYAGSFTIEAGGITVSSEFGTKSARIGRLEAHWLAEQLLREMIADKDV